MDDLISRQAAIDIANDIRACISVDGYWAWLERLKKLPSAQLIDQVKRGKWEYNEYLYTTGQTRCSACKTEFYIDDLLNVGEGAQEFLPQYCPHCGAKIFKDHKNTDERLVLGGEIAAETWNRRVREQTIVRCKNCRYFHKSPTLMGQERDDGRCEWIDDRLVGQNHYCSWGTERSEDAD